jgi:hypothetical protein
MSNIKRYVKLTLLTAFVTLTVMMSYNNCVRTELAILNVEEFFIRTRTIQGAQMAADRAMALVEDKSHHYNDLMAATERLAAERSQLSMALQKVTMYTQNLEQIVHAQNRYIETLKNLLHDEGVTAPPQPRINLGPPTCPSPQGGNSSNLPKPISPTPPDPHKSADGSFPRNSTGRDAFGTADFHEA